MAIPNSPNWSSLTDIKPYPQPSFVKPPVPTGVAAVSLGPIELNNSKGVLNSRYWLVTQLDGQVLIQGATGEAWMAPDTLFNEPLPIQQISLTFDQLGRPLVFYRVGADTLKLYWYDPITQQNVLTNFGIGKDPTACFDFPQDTGQSFTDALLFYVRDDQVFMRIQRDRYAIEYPCPAIQPGMKIKSAGLRVDNRLQVAYQFSDDEYSEPIIEIPEIEVVDPVSPDPIIPEEPVEPEEPDGPIIVVGRWVYKQPLYSAIYTDTPAIDNLYNFKAGLSLREIENKSNLNILLAQGANESITRVVAHSRFPTKFLIMHYKSRDNSKGVFLVKINGYEHYFPSNQDLTDGVYEFEIKNNFFTVNKNNVLVASGNIVQVANPITDLGPTTFGSAVNRFNDLYRENIYSVKGIVYNAWVQNDNIKTYWLIENKVSSIQLPNNGINKINILNYDENNWRYIIV